MPVMKGKRREESAGEEMPTFGAARQQDLAEHSPSHTHRVTPIPPGPGESLPEIAGGASNAQSTGQIGFR